MSHLIKAERFGMPLVAFIRTMGVVAGLAGSLTACLGSDSTDVDEADLKLSEGTRPRPCRRRTEPSVRATSPERAPVAVESSRPRTEGQILDPSLFEG